MRQGADGLLGDGLPQVREGHGGCVWLAAERGPVCDHPHRERPRPKPVGRRPYDPDMLQRTLGRTGRTVGEVGLGAWQLGADWGEVADPLGVLAAAVDAGVSFIDTADVYGDGRSEQLIREFRRAYPEAELTVATKMGRRVTQVPENYTMANFRSWTDRSRANLGVETLDLVQLHCPPTPVYADDAVFDALDALVDEGAIAAYGVSVETRAQALAAIARPHTATVQIILNMLRLGPVAEVLPAAQAAGVGIIARVPLASGLLSGRYDAGTTFDADDHRTYNRHGEAFDVGETFSGVDYAVGLRAVDRLRAWCPADATMAAFALRWILDQPAVSVVIPGARTPEQVRGNVAAADLAPLPATTIDAVHTVYDELVAPLIGDRW
jgi:aryl-alcohol dehydrogenase-like predicted oxidoreductase